jgi:hypothetical protein
LLKNHNFEVALAVAWARHHDTWRFSGLASQIAENSILSLILGGAAVRRCDRRLGIGAGFSR